MPLRITSWNVNGIRNPFAYQPWREKRTFEAMFDILETDIVVIQETKIQRKDLKDDMVLVPGWDVFFSLPKHKKGYSGVAIYTRSSVCCPIRAEEGITGVLCPPNSSTSFRDLPESQQIGGYPRAGQLTGELDDVTLDSEGRAVVLEFPAFVLIGTYSPATRDSSRNDFRVGFLEALDVRVRNLVAAGKQVILTGDLNVIRSAIDTCNLVEMLRKEGMTMEDWMMMPSRRLFNQLVFDGNVVGKRDEGREEPVLWDICRRFHPSREGMFTCWDTKRNTRPANNGSRIDYLLCSSGIKDWFQDANIQEGLMGSDHCPVFGTMKDHVKCRGREVPLLDLMNPKDMVQNGMRVREWSQKDLLPLSAKLIPEFDRRRSIRDMFMKKSAPSKAPVLSTKPAEFSALAGTTKVETSKSNKDQDTPHLATSDRHLPPLQPTEARTESDDKIPASLLLPRPSPTKPTTTTTRSKRPADTVPASKRTLKKSKTTESEKFNAGGLAQSTLKGFFKPKSSPHPPIGSTKDQPEVAQDPASLSPSEEQTNTPVHESPIRSQQSTSSVPIDTSPSRSERVFDPIQTKESWSKLQLGKRVVPKCEHGEPCISLVTKKPGVNCGRSFYICPRPLGPSGEKEMATEWRCGTFIWSSDWRKDQA